MIFALTIFALTAAEEDADAELIKNLQSEIEMTSTLLAEARTLAQNGDLHGKVTPEQHELLKKLTDELEAEIKALNAMDDLTDVEKELVDQLEEIELEADKLHEDLEEAVNAPASDDAPASEDAHAHEDAHDHEEAEAAPVEPEAPSVVAGDSEDSAALASMVFAAIAAIAVIA